MADYTKDDIKVSYANQVFEDGDTLTAEHMKKINAGILEAASSEKVANQLNIINNKLGTVPDGVNVMEEINKKADQLTTYTKTEVDTALSEKAASNQGPANKGKFWKVGEDGGLTFEAGVPVDTTLTKTGEAADAAAVGNALNEKGDSLYFDSEEKKLYLKSGDNLLNQNNGITIDTDLSSKGDKIAIDSTTKKLQLISTAEDTTETVLAEVDLPEGVSDLKLTGDILQLVKPNNSTLGQGTSLAGYAKTNNVYTKAALDGMGLEAVNDETVITLRLIKADGNRSEVIIPKTTTAEYYQIDTVSSTSFSTIVGNPKTPQQIEYRAGYWQGNSWDTSPYYEKWTVTKPNGATATITRTASFVDLTGTDSQYFDFTPYLGTGENTVFLGVYTNPEYTGTPEKTRTWKVNSVDFGFTATFPNPVTCGSEAIISCTLPQNTQKTLVLITNGDTEHPTIADLAANVGNYSFSVRSDLHGTNQYEVKMKTTIGNQEIETNSQFGSAIWYDIANPIPIIGVSQTNYITNQYDETNIFYLPFAYYNNSGENLLKVRIYSDENGGKELIYTDTVASGTKTSYKYPAETLSNEIHLTIELQAEELITEQVINFKVVKGQYDFTPVMGETFSFTPKKYTNANFSNTNHLSIGNGVELILGDNFDLTSGGFVRTGDQTYFRVPAYNRIYIQGSNLFNSYNDCHFKMVFKTVNARNATTFLTNGSGIGSGYIAADYGVRLDTEKGVITANDTIAASSVFATDTVIDYAFNVVNPARHTENKIYTSQNGASIPEGYREGDYQDLTLQKHMIMPYEDGVASLPKVYTEEDMMNLSFNTEANCLEIGSDDCEVYIYVIRAYARALGIDDICTNFSIDATSLAERKERYDKNNWFITSGVNNILKNPEEAAKLMPNTKIVLITAPRFTNDKNDEVQNTYIQVLQNKVLDSSNKEVDNTAFNWITEGGTHCGQGTSSNEYGFSARNLTITLGNAVYQGANTIYSPTENGSLSEYASSNGWVEVPEKKVQIAPGSVENDVFNIKVNVASSENQNNAGMARLYNLVNDAIYKRPAKYRNPKIKDTIEFDNCIIYIRETTEKASERQEFQIGDGESWHFYGIGNFGDSKDSDATRMDNKWSDSSNSWQADPKEVIVESMDFNVALAGFNNIDQQCGLLPYVSGKSSYLEGEYEQLLGVEDYKTFGNILKYDTTFEENGETVTRHGLYEWDSKKSEYKFEGFGVFPQAKLEKGTYAKELQCSYEFRYEIEDIASIQRDENIENWWSFYEQIYTIYSKLNNGTYSVQRAKKELSKFMIVDSAILYFLFTERFCLIDNRAKNLFWHYSKKYYSEDEVQRMPAGLKTKLKEANIINNDAAAINEGYRWDLCFGYDFDTALGIDNVGKYAFEYGLETNDRIFKTEVTTYDASTGEKETTNGFNYFFELIQGFGYTELSNIYNTNNVKNIMAASGEDGTILYWDKKQREFPEKVWLRDIERKYIRISEEYFQVDGSITKNSGEQYSQDVRDAKSKKDYLSDKANGLKRYHRREFENKQSLYMNSRWSVGEDTATFRFKPGCQPGQITVTFSQRGYYNTCLLSDGNDWGTPVKNWEGSGETIKLTNITTASGEYYIIYPASIISAISFPEEYTGNVLEMNSSMLLSGCKKLTEISFGTTNSSQKPKIGITNDSFSGCPLLTSINLTNCLSYEGSGTFGLNLTKNLGFEQLLAEGSGLIEVSFAPNGLLTTATLNKIKKLSLVNLPMLQTLDVDDKSILESLRLENCPRINSYNFVTSIVEQETQPLKYLRLIGIDWDETRTIDLTQPGKNFFDKLGKIGGISESGNTFTLEDSEEYKGSILAGSAKVEKNSTRMKTKYGNWWPDLYLAHPTKGPDENPEEDANWFVSEYKADFYKYNPKTGNADLLIDTRWTNATTGYVISLENLDIRRRQEKEYDYLFDGWKQIINLETGSYNKLPKDDTETSIRDNTRFEADYLPEARRYTIHWMYDKDNPIKENGQSLVTEIEYGEGAEYPGTAVPVKNPSTNKLTHYLFSGWSGYPYRPEPVLKEEKDEYGLEQYEDIINIYATFEEGTASDANSTNTKIPLNSLKPAELNAYCMLAQESKQEELIRKAFNFGDTIDIELGWDPTKDANTPENRKPIFDLIGGRDADKVTVYYANNEVATEVNVTGPVSMNFDSSRNGAIRYINTGVKLFEMSEFTIVLDYQFNDRILNRWNGGTSYNTTDGQYLLSCTNGQGTNSLSILRNNSNGFAIRVDEANGQIINNLATGLATKYLTGYKEDTGDKILEGMPISGGQWKDSSNYDRIVIRKKEGSSNMDIYCGLSHLTYLEKETANNLCGSEITAGPIGNGIKHFSIPFTYDIVQHSGELILGRNLTKEANTLCNCTIDTLKIWDSALTDAEVLKMANYPKETLTLQLSQMPGYLNYKTGNKQQWYGYQGQNGIVYPGVILESTGYFRNRRKPEGDLPTDDTGKNHQTMHNRQGWANMGVCKWLNSRIYEALPQVWRSAIKNVSVTYITEKFQADGTPFDPWRGEIGRSNLNIFVPSIREYYNTKPSISDGHNLDNEPYQSESIYRTYQLFDEAGTLVEQIGDPSDNDERIKLYRFGDYYLNGFNRSRTAVEGKSGYFRVQDSGTPSAGTSHNYKACVDCAFCI